MHLSAPTRRTRPSGFTLIELLITVAILGILASLAYPSFIESIRKSRRADAVSALTRIQLAQEAWRGNHGTFSGDLGATGLNLSTNSPDGHYALTITENDATAFTVVATVKSASPQMGDVTCRSMQIRTSNVIGRQGIAEHGSTNSSGTLNTSSPNPCWIK